MSRSSHRGLPAALLMAKLQATVKLQRLTFLGPLNDEIEAMASGIDVPVVHCDTLAAGFARTP